MQVTLANNNNVSISIAGNISEIDYQWRIKPLKDLLEHFIDENNYFDKLFDAIYRLQRWAEEKRLKIKIYADYLFKTTYYFFCKIRENE